MRVQTLPCFSPPLASERSLETARIVVCPSPSVFFAWALCRLLPYGLSVTRRSIGQTLANDAFQRTSGTLYVIYVIYAKPDTLAIAEIKFCKVSVQMFLATVLVCRA
jgi:hypothetical protein